MDLNSFHWLLSNLVCYKIYFLELIKYSIPHESEFIILLEFATHVTPTRIASEMVHLFAISLSGLVGVRLDIIQRHMKVHCRFYRQLILGPHT